MKKRILSVALVLCFTLALVPTMAIAAAANYIEIIPLKYSAATPFSEGLAAVSISGWGIGGYDTLIDKTGNVIAMFPSKYDYIAPFSEGLAVVSTGVSANDEPPRCGFIDKSGNEVISLKFNWALSFSEGLAAVGFWNYGTGYGFIDKNGNEVIPPKYSDVESFSEGFAAVALRDGNKDLKWGFIDKAGKEVIPPKYDWVKSFSEGLAVVSINGKCGFIDKAGKEIISLKYNHAGSFSEGLAYIAIDDGDFGYKYGFIDKTGKEVIRPVKYDMAGSFSEGVAAVALMNTYSDLNWGYIDKTGNEVIPIEFHQAEPFSEGAAAVALGKWPNIKYGFIDKRGMGITPFEYDMVQNFSEGMAAVVIGDWQDYDGDYLIGKWGFIAINSDSAPNLDTATWARDDIQRAFDMNLIPQALQSNYTRPTTRAEFCALAVALYENVTGKPIAERKTFTDTKDVNVEKAAAVGVVNGTNREGTLFSPDDRLTREQAAAMLSRLANAVGKPLKQQAPAFDDNSRVSPYAVDAVGQMQATGIMTGNNNRFSPGDPYTREQSIVTILRLYDAVK